MTVETKVNPKDPRVRRTRQLLKQALSDLLSERPFHEVTVQDITDQATLNRVTFYAHFDDKYDLFSSWIRDDFASRLEAELPSSSELSERNLRLLCRVVLQTLKETQAHCRPVHERYTPLFESAIQKALFAFILEWLSSADQKSDRRVSVENLATIMSWMMFGTGIDWSRSSKPQTVDRLVDDMMTVLLQGVSHMFN